jgi:hypothetical protein
MAALRLPLSRRVLVLLILAAILIPLAYGFFSLVETARSAARRSSDL